MSFRFTGRCLIVLALVLGARTPAGAALTVSVEASPAAAQTAGLPVNLLASSTGAGSAVWYQFAVRSPGGAFRIVRDYYYYNVFPWGTLEGGIYDIRVRAWVPDSGESAESIVRYSMVSAATVAPVLFPSFHPLVLVYSAPPCSAGTIRVRYQRIGATLWQATPSRSCVPGRSLNFYLAGLYAGTDYLVQQEVVGPSGVIRGPLLNATSGALGVTLKNTYVTDAADVTTSLLEPFLLTTFIGVTFDTFPVAYDLAGNAVWYYPLPQTNLTRPVAGGTMLTLVRDGYNGRILREIDLSGNAVRETNVDFVNKQLEARGDDRIGALHHEALRLPNGHTAVIASVERILTDVQGPGDVNVYGEMILVLDASFHVVWTWNAFEHLDPARVALLGETCIYEGPGCPALFLGPTANDWLHGNSLQLTQDGHLLFSIRHQDWVIKIDYQNGAGSGDVLWRLGKNGDFQMISADPSPWFSHQHDPSLRDGVLVVYDNGNVRVQAGGGNSRGQVMYLDEVRRIAVMLRNFDLGAYAEALGSAQRLANGDYHFDSGFLNGKAEQIEVTPDGTRSFVFGSDALVYRSFRLRDLFRGVP